VKLLQTNVSLLQTKWSTPTAIGYPMPWYTPCNRHPNVYPRTTFKYINT